MRPGAGSLLDRLPHALPSGALALAAALALRKLNDYDTWWHLAAGRWILENRRIMDADVLSFTVAGREWVNLQWLFDLAVAGVFAAGGPSALVLLSTIAVASAVALALRGVRRHVGPVSASVLTLWVTLIAQERFLARPELVSLLCLQAVLYLLATGKDDSGRRLWLLVPCMLLWVNAHALFVVGLFCILSAAAVALLSETPLVPPPWRSATRADRLLRRRLLVSALLSSAVVAVNPYGLKGALFPLELWTRLGHEERSFFRTIGEFQPPFSDYFVTPSIHAYRLFIVVAALVAVLAAATALLTRRAGASRRPADPAAFDLTGLVIFLGLAVLSLKARRNTGLFALGVAPFLAQCLGILSSRLSPFVPRPPRPVARGAAAGLAAGMLVLLAFVTSNGFYRWHFQRHDLGVHEFGLGIQPDFFPARAVAFARSTGLPGRTFSDLGAGGYLSWDPPPGGAVYVDGRLEVYDQAFLRDYMSALGNFDLWQQRADLYGVGSVVLVHRFDYLERLIGSLERHPAWEMVYYDSVAVVFVRREGNATRIGSARRMFQEILPGLEAELLRGGGGWRHRPARLAALTAYGNFLMKRGDCARAVVFHEAALALKPVRAAASRLHLQLVNCLVPLGQTARAWQHLEQAAALDPPNPLVQKWRARLGDEPP